MANDLSFLKGLMVKKKIEENNIDLDNGAEEVTETYMVYNFCENAEIIKIAVPLLEVENIDYYITNSNCVEDLSAILKKFSAKIIK